MTALTENDYMDCLDEVYYEGYGLLLKKGDSIAFQVGFNEWKRENSGSI